MDCKPGKIIISDLILEPKTCIWFDTTIYAHIALIPLTDDLLFPPVGIPNVSNYT